MRVSLLTLAALAAFSLPTSAQDKAPRVGVITGQGPVEVTVAKGKLWQQRGESCVLRPGDKIGFIADVAGTDPVMVVVHKQYDSRFHVGKPDLKVCIRGKDVFMPKARFEAAVADFVKQESEKPKKKRGSKGLAAKN